VNRCATICRWDPSRWRRSSDAFLAHSGDRAVLDDLATRLGGVAADADRLRQLVELAASRSFTFDD
jgi:hypothetical protein